MIRGIIILLIFFSHDCLFSQNEFSQDKENSIVDLLELAKDNEKTPIEKLSYAEKAKRSSIEIENDSLIIESSRLIAMIHYELRNFNLFKKASKEYLNYSMKINDSSSIARAYGFLGKFYLKASISDSSYFYYYNSEKIYRSLGDSKSVGFTLSEIAMIQKNEKDFIGSEVTSVEAISILEPLDDYRILSSLYNNLGIIYNELGQYKQAITYHEKALKLRKILKKESLINASLNNIAVVYKNSAQYDKAIEYFEELLAINELRNNQPSFYALIIDNYAHTKFLLNETSQIPKLYFEALKVCDSVNETYNTIAIKTHLSEYYTSINKMDSAKYYAYEAKNIAERFHNDDYLKALLHLSNIENDSLSVKYYREYIKLNDSLQSNERAIRNKFARIRYETKEIEERNEQITKERMYLLILSIGLLLTTFLTYSVITQRAKNKELRLNQLQQEANEEIYNLMLSQQDKIDEGRAKEKKRISEELHDGILGRLFGTRLSLDSLNLSNKEDAAKNRSVYIEELKSIEEEIRRISHDLSSDFVEGTGYFDIIKTLVENQTQAYQLSYNIIKKGEIDWEGVTNKTKINLYRIVQESLQNIYKHANANHVEIKFESTDEFIILEIADNGSGFDTSKSKKGIGLKNIKSRAEELNGELTIKSTKEQGTKILVKVPN